MNVALRAALPLVTSVDDRITGSSYNGVEIYFSSAKMLSVDVAKFLLWNDNKMKHHLITFRAERRIYDLLPLARYFLRDLGNMEELRCRSVVEEALISSTLYDKCSSGERFLM
jgi:hypothetical protein